MFQAITPLSMSSWCGVQLSTGTALSFLPYKYLNTYDGGEQIKAWLQLMFPS
jgi:hypothetical protein